MNRRKAAANQRRARNCLPMARSACRGTVRSVVSVSDLGKGSVAVASALYMINNQKKV